jgi:hypothetical protein
MWCKFFLCWCHKHLLINLSLFWGCEQCIRTLGQFTTWIYYYLKDLNHVYFACWGLHYGIENQTLFFDDEPSKAFQNSRCNGLLLQDINYQKIRSNGWTSHPIYGQHWLDCCWQEQLVSIMKLVRYSKPSWLLCQIIFHSCNIWKV